MRWAFRFGSLDEDEARVLTLHDTIEAARTAACDHVAMSEFSDCDWDDEEDLAYIKSMLDLLEKRQHYRAIDLFNDHGEAKERALRIWVIPESDL